MSDDEIRKLLELEALATPGPWAIKEDSANGEDEYWGYWHDVGPLSLPNKEADENDRFVAAARDAVRPLCEELLRLRAERDAAVAEAVAKERERVRAMNRWMRGIDKAVEDDIRRGE